MTAGPGNGFSGATARGAALRQHKSMDSKSAESDAPALRRSVIARLIADPLVRTGQVRVAANGGEVTLSGYVSSNAQRDAAITATHRVEGVKKVVNQLEVEDSCPAAADRPAQPSRSPLPPKAPPPLIAFRASPHLLA